MFPFLFWHVFISIPRCWILDNNVHLIVNVGYYALIFLITFSTFIFILSQLFCQKRLKTPNAQTNRGGKNIISVMGICSMLGISWGFIFFSHGVFRIPAYYIFTVLNSFQGICYCDRLGCDPETYFLYLILIIYISIIISHRRKLIWLLFF